MNTPNQKFLKALVLLLTVYILLMLFVYIIFSPTAFQKAMGLGLAVGALIFKFVAYVLINKHIK